MTEILSVIVPVTPMRSAPQSTASLESECLFGEHFRCVEDEGDWIKGQNLTDAYDGWLEKKHLGELSQPTHRVSTVRTVLTAEQSVKSATLCHLSMGARVSVRAVIDRLAEIDFPRQVGYMPVSHLEPLDAISKDWVSVAESFNGTPYRWGGRDSLGIDCSALVQLSLQSGGILSPRDSCDQVQSLGVELESDPEYRRGDLVFWPGHVGIMLNGTDLLHANAYHGKVVSEPLIDVSERSLHAEGPITAVKRLAGKA